MIKDYSLFLPLTGETTHAPSPPALEWSSVDNNDSPLATTRA